MNVPTLNIDREVARELWRKYQAHRAWQAPHDAQIAAIYKRIAQGRTVIRALDAIRQAGLNEQGLPKLAIARADQTECFVRTWNGTEVRFSSTRWPPRSKSKVFEIGSFPGITRSLEGRGAVPLIPIHLRPKRGLQNYHILWEAEWSRVYPADPYLLRRFGEDAWLVVAAWDLTDVERAVMGGRLHG